MIMMALARERFVSLVHNRLDLHALLLELEDCGSVLSELPVSDCQLLTKAFIGALYEGVSVSVVKCLCERGVLHVPSLQQTVLLSVRQLSLNQLVGLATVEVLDFSSLISRDMVEHLSSLLTESVDWGNSHMQDFLCWSISLAYPQTLPTSTDNVQRIVVSLIHSLSHSAQWEPVVQTLKGRVEDSVLDDLASQILVDTITSTSKLQFSSVVNVLSCQSEWGYSSLSITTKRFFHIILQCSRSPLAVLKASLAYHNDVNWCNLISLTVCLLHTQPLTDFREAVDQLLESSLCQDSQFLFHCSLVMGRQASFEGVDFFPSYLGWLKQLCDQIKSCKKHIQRFIKWLCALVPFEPLHTLKNHSSLICSNLPFGSLTKELTKELKDLTETRLLELKEPVDTQFGIPLSERTWVIADIEKAVSQLKSGGTSPLDFLKKLQFVNKAYYNEKLLRYLLSPSNHGNQDVTNLINILEQNKMIPQNMLKEYKNQSEIEGDIRLFSLMDTLIECGESNVLSEISQCLLTTPYVTTEHIQFVDRLLSRVAQVLSQYWPSWLVGLLSILSGHPIYCKALTMRLGELTSQQIDKLTQVQLAALSQLLAFLFELEYPIQCMKESAEDIVRGLPVWSCDQVVAMATLQLCSQCMECIESRGNSQSSISARVIYLKHRLMYADTECPSSMEYQVPFDEWLDWELLRGEKDYLSPAQRYLYLRDRINKFLLSSRIVEHCALCFKALCCHSLTSPSHMIFSMLVAGAPSSCLSSAIESAVMELCDHSLPQRLEYLLLCVPPHKLLSKETNLPHCLRLIMCQGSEFIPSLPLIIHLLGDNDLCTLSPIYFAALIVHAPHLPLLPPTIKSEVNWLHSTGYSFPATSDPMWVGVSLFCVIRDHSNRRADLIRLLTFVTLPTRTIMCETVMDCCVRSMAHYYPQQPEPIQRLAKDVMELSPASVLVCNYEPPSQKCQELRQEFPCKANLSLCSVLLFEMLDECSLIEMTKVCPEIFKLVLSAHKTLMESHCQLIKLVRKASRMVKLLLQSFPQLATHQTCVHQSLKSWINSLLSS